MKTIIISIAALCAILYAHDVYQRQNSILSVPSPRFEYCYIKPAISVIHLDDITISGSLYGVVTSSTDVFQPYFDEIERDIELHFGIIDSMSSDKLISVMLPAKRFLPPKLKDLKKLSEREKRIEKVRYLEELKEHTKDSVEYYSDRKRRIEVFKGACDYLIASYCGEPSRKTDLIPTVAIADKIFNYSQFGETRKYIIYNSDGIDSNGRKARKLRNKAECILVNAGIDRSTSLDSVVTMKLASVEQAIQFTLRSK